MGKKLLLMLLHPRFLWLVSFILELALISGGVIMLGLFLNSDFGPSLRASWENCSDQMDFIGQMLTREISVYSSRSLMEQVLFIGQDLLNTLLQNPLVLLSAFFVGWPMGYYLGAKAEYRHESLLGTKWFLKHCFYLLVWALLFTLIILMVFNFMLVIHVPFVLIMLMLFVQGVRLTAFVFFHSK